MSAYKSKTPKWKTEVSHHEKLRDAARRNMDYRDRSNSQVYYFHRFAVDLLNQKHRPLSKRDNFRLSLYARRRAVDLSCGFEPTPLPSWLSKKG